MSLTDLYEFLKAYRKLTNNIDQLFEKNVRRFLGGRVKVNKGMQATLRNAPERFGLYNNGITIVVSDFKMNGQDSFELIEPYVVNGCQTTRTIWEVCNNLLDSGGSGKNQEVEGWRQRAAGGCVVTKVAKVGEEGEELLQAITRYTNSQNAVREKDFVALSRDFKDWQRQLDDKFGLYFEIQRGGWDSQRAIQKQNPTGQQFQRHANALDLVKVYGSGWLAEPGLAFGKNPPFLPNGAVFTRMTTPADAGPSFGARDLYAAFLVQQSGQKLGFGRGGPPARRQTKFLFYFVTINLLRDVLQKQHMNAVNSDVSEAIIKLLSAETAGGAELELAASQLIDAYLTEGDENCALNEPAFRSVFNFDLNAFLKWEDLGRKLDATPGLQAMLFFQKQFMGKSNKGMPSARTVIVDNLSEDTARSGVSAGFRNAC